MNQNLEPVVGTHKVMALLANALTKVGLPLLDSAVKASQLPFSTPDMIRPNIHSKYYGWTHYGIFFPDLPEPHKYCNIMTLLGATGSTIFDNDYLVKTNPRDTATFFSSTAANGVHHYQAYSIANECQIIEDGSLIQFGDHLAISGTYPEYHIRAAYGDFQLDVAIHCTDQVGWFLRNVVYDHFSLLAKCSGTITYAGVTTPIERLCTFEYARCISPHSVTKNILPDSWKLPIDFFTYQIINADESTQILLTDARSLGTSAFKGVHIRSLNGDAQIHVDDVDFKITAYRDELAVDPEGRTMRLPKTFSWGVRDKGQTILNINCTIDAEWRYGHGRGYASCYRFTGEFNGKSFDGQGYIEYIDCERLN
ncbi:DUF6670 family protein [Aquirhabdus parva]|nr:DUF6670 family protein [Aquirhabdus parva]